MRSSVLIGLTVFGIYLVIQIMRTQQLIKVGEKMAAETVAYTRHVEDPTFTILFVGDSTAVGVGASTPEKSIAGLVANRYPAAEIVNNGVSGAKAVDVLEHIKQIDASYDLIMIHAGGNDVVRFTSLHDFRNSIRTILELAKQKAPQVLLTSTGNVGTVPLFPAPTRWIFDRRSRSIRDILIEEVARAGATVRYTDLFRERPQDPFAEDPKTYYAKDQFHPSDAGYADWFSFIDVQLDQFTF